VKAPAPGSSPNAAGARPPLARHDSDLPLCVPSDLPLCVPLRIDDRSTTMSVTETTTCHGFSIPPLWPQPVALHYSLMNKKVDGGRDRQWQPPIIMADAGEWPVKLCGELAGK